MKKSFILYSDIYDSIKLLSIENKGQLLDAIFMYAIEGKTLPLKSETEMAFSFIKRTMDRDLEKWNNMVKRNTENIKKRYLPKPTKSTTGRSGIPNALDSDSVNVSVSVNENVIEDLPQKISNRLILSKGQLIAFAKEYPGITTTEINEQRIKCNAYMNMSSENVGNPGLFFRKWLARYMKEKTTKDSSQSYTESIINNLPKLPPEKIEENLAKLAEMRKNLRIRRMP